MFDKFKCEAKLNVAFGFVLKTVEDGTCRYYYPHENNRLMERSKFVVTKEDLVEIKNKLSNTDVLEACAEERANTKWKLYKLTNVIVFPAPIRDVLMGCKGAVLSKRLTKNHTVFVWITKRVRENRTLTIYVSLELSFCICVEMRDLKEKNQKCLDSSWRKLRN